MVQLNRLLLLLVFLVFAQNPDLSAQNQTTICNPINLSYRFCIDTPSRREAADPTMIVFKDEYYLFASKSGGYFHSTDLIHWNLIITTDLPLEDYAPTAMVMNDTVYFMASSAVQAIYKTADPKSGHWKMVEVTFPPGLWDPCLFLDDDKRVFLYYGCSNVNPIYGVELDPTTFNPVRKPVELFNSKREIYGWERKGDYNELGENPWIEGAWMTKYKGKYYLQYAGPGTEYKSYSDGVYISDSPLGEFKLASNNPCSAKPEGFIAAAGHSNTFQDIYGNYWHISTMTISQKHMFERRLGLFPAFFDEDGEFSVYTGFGDFPFNVPIKKIAEPEVLFPSWMLLSYNKPVEVSSELPDYPKNHAADEEIRTYWSAQTGRQGEWISIDLQHTCTVNAVQINYAENETELLGRSQDMYYQYLLEYSNDNVTWNLLADKTENRTDIPHDYIEFNSPVRARYIKLTNYRVPDGTFALAGLRVFGNGGGPVPLKVKNLEIVRSENDRCEAIIKWDNNPDAVGFNIRYGDRKNKLYHNYQVLGTNSLTIRSLSAVEKYYFTIDAFNENGITRGGKIIEVK